MALNLNFHIQNPDNWELFLDRLAQALLALHGQRPIELHTLPMEAGFKEHDDAEILSDFARRVPGIAMILHRPGTPADTARIIDGCDLLVSERLHAIVTAALLGVPAFVLAYDGPGLDRGHPVDLVEPRVLSSGHEFPQPRG